MKFLSLIFGFLLHSGHIFAHAGVQASAPWIACELKKRNDLCEYRDHHLDTHYGTCQKAAGKLICIRNKPIVKDKEK